MSVKALHQSLGLHPHQIAWIGTELDEMLSSLARPKVGKELWVIPLGFPVGPHQTREYPVQVTNDLVSQCSASLDLRFAIANPVLQMEIIAAQWPVCETLVPQNQVADGAKVDLVGFLAA